MKYVFPFSLDKFISDLQDFGIALRYVVENQKCQSSIQKSKIPRYELRQLDAGKDALERARAVNGDKIYSVIAREMTFLLRNLKKISAIQMEKDDINRNVARNLGRWFDHDYDISSVDDPRLLTQEHIFLFIVSANSLATKGSIHIGMGYTPHPDKNSHGDRTDHSLRDARNIRKRKSGLDQQTEEYLDMCIGEIWARAETIVLSKSSIDSHISESRTCVSDALYQAIYQREESEKDILLDEQGFAGVPEGVRFEAVIVSEESAH